MKACTRCGLTQPLSGFPRDKRATDGAASRCKECVRVYRESRRDKHAEYCRSWVAKNHEKVLRQKAAHRERKADVLRVKNRERRRRWLDVPENAERAREMSRAWGKAHAAERLEKDRRARALEPEKVRARSRVNRAVRDGRLVKPEACSRCGATQRIEAHHEDYSRPLDVTWMCARCHRRVHVREARDAQGGVT